jgi:hypothetical protein
MEKMLNEWKLYTKKILLEKLYDENINEKVIDFLKNYELLKVDVLNNNAYEFEIEISFALKNETVKINAGFQARDFYFHWTIPEKFDIMQLEDIMEKFQFPSYFVDIET